MHRITRFSTWGKPGVPVQRNSSASARTFSPRLQPKGGTSPSCGTSSRQLLSASHFLRGADHVQSLPECVLDGSSSKSSSALKNYEQHSAPTVVLSPIFLTPGLHESVDAIQEQDLGTDLGAMVLDYIENGSNSNLAGHGNIADGRASDSTDLTHQEILQDVFLNTPFLEKELLSVINTIILSIKDTDLASFACNMHTRGGCIRRLIVWHLQLMKYDAAVRLSKWPTFGKVPGGEYEYIDVIFDKGTRQINRLIVDVDFRSQFEIARPTQPYLAAVRCLPVIFVGSVDKLSQILQTLADAAKLSMKQNAMPVPPWRTLPYMTCKWSSPLERPSMKQKKSNGKSSSIEGFGRGTHVRSTEQCIQQLHHLKMCCFSCNAGSKVLRLSSLGATANVPSSSQ